LIQAMLNMIDAIGGKSAEVWQSYNTLLIGNLDVRQGPSLSAAASWGPHH
jgi:hypothetical protein